MDRPSFTRPPQGGFSFHQVSVFNQDGKAAAILEMDTRRTAVEMCCSEVCDPWKFQARRMAKAYRHKHEVICASVKMRGARFTHADEGELPEDVWELADRLEEVL